jgi:hypothetical protein
MRHHNSVLHGLLKHIPWSVFDNLVDEYGADARVRRLSTKSQLVALLYGQLSGSVSLREIETAMESHSTRLYHLGAREVSRSTLSDANRLRPHAVFSKLFSHMAGMADGGRRGSGELVRLIDSTGIKLAGVASEWARFSRGVHGAKAHIVYDPDADAPLYLEVTAANVNDITPAKAMPIDPEATYVFDLGYYDFAWWAKLDQAGCRIVTRIKSHSRLTDVRQLPLPRGSSLLYDRIGHLNKRLGDGRPNPFTDPVREIGVVLEDGKTTLRVLTNDLDAPADEIAALYKRRWAIELFFRWVKQTLRIKHFLGRSENAVRIQIAVALIAYLLLRLAKAASKIMGSPLAFARLIRSNLMHRRHIDQLTRPSPPQPQDSRQLSLDLIMTLPA